MVVNADIQYQGTYTKRSVLASNPPPGDKGFMQSFQGGGLPAFPRDPLDRILLPVVSRHLTNHLFDGRKFHPGGIPDLFRREADLVECCVHML